MERPAPAGAGFTRLRVVPAIAAAFTTWRWGAAFCAAILSLTAATLAAETATGPATPTPRTIVFFGDSLTAGYGLENPATESYPAIIQQKLDQAHLPWRAVNAGLSGETTAGGVRRIDWVLRQRVDIFVLALGGNDGLRGIDPEVSEENLEQIVARVRAKNPAAQVIVAGMQMPPGMGEDYTRRFQAIFSRVAAKTHSILLPFLLEGVGGRADLNQADGIHPTAAGHQQVADTVWKTLHPLL